MIYLPTIFEFEVCNITRYVDMKCVVKYKNGVVRGHRRSSAMSPFDRAHTTSYLSLIETTHLSCTVFNTASYLSKFANFDLSHLHLAAPLGVTPFEFQKDFWHQKTRVPVALCA